MKYFRLAWFHILIMSMISNGCKDDKAIWEAAGRKIINDYIQTLGDTVYVLKPSGLYYIELKEGTGAYPVVNDSVFFKYRAMFLDFVEYNRNTPYTKPAGAKIGSGNMITGIDEGLRYMRVGETAKLIIPSKLAYGII